MSNSDSGEKTEATTVNPTVEMPSLNAEWLGYIGPFATAIGKTPAEVTVALEKLVGPPGQEAIELLQSVEYTPDGDITDAVGSGVPVAKLKKAIAGLRKVANIPSHEAATVSAASVSFDVLPTVPTDQDWLAALKVGGVLKFNKHTVIAAVSAALANQAGLYTLPEKITQAMERQAQDLEEPVGEDFFNLTKILTRREYGEVFSAIPGVDGRFATKARKDQLLERINNRFWKSLIEFHGQLKGWVESWQAGMANPAAMMGIMAAMSGGMGMVPPGMMQPPTTDILRDAAENVIKNINYVFAGTGIPVALALAYDAQQIIKALENPALPAQVGAQNREQMLRQLGAAVSSDYPRLDRNLKQYTLGIIELQNVTAGNAELQYVIALYQLGAMIPWDKLVNSVPSKLVLREGMRSGIGSSQ